ncbi:hypothetical protein CXU18_00555 [Akkermansia muciniphila]|nr:hypothetical protein CXU18_00555 [Akkermansia muciniphila]PNC29547.1 hypothetical protein CXU17_08355 [Akkermansia muciniphila]PNC48452.1 hypothetical protein CXU11_08405 [Akkermansia muciniphila]
MEGMANAAAIIISKYFIIKWGFLNNPLLLPRASLVSLFLVMHVNYTAMRPFLLVNGSPA